MLDEENMTSHKTQLRCLSEYLLTFQQDMNLDEVCILKADDDL